MKLRVHEYGWTLAGVVAGIIVCAAISPMDYKYFFPNFTIYWGSQLSIILIFLLFSPRKSVVGGLSFALAIFIYAFKALLAASHDPNAALGWLFYFWLLPFALASGAWANSLIKGKISWGPALAFFVTAGYVLVGVTAIPAIIWVARMVRL